MSQPASRRDRRRRSSPRPRAVADCLVRRNRRRRASSRSRGNARAASSVYDRADGTRAAGLREGRPALDRRHAGPRVRDPHPQHDRRARPGGDERRRRQRRLRRDRVAVADRATCSSPYECVEINGWRKSLSRTAAFYFTELPRRLRGAHRPSATTSASSASPFSASGRHASPSASRSAEDRRSTRAERRRHARTPPRADARAPRERPRRSDAARRRHGRRARRRRATTERRLAKLGTGHGRSEQSHVQRDALRARERRRPTQTLSIHYDRRENLIAMGILPPPRDRRATPSIRFPPGRRASRRTRRRAERVAAHADCAPRAAPLAYLAGDARARPHRRRRRPRRGPDARLRARATPRRSTRSTRGTRAACIATCCASARNAGVADELFQDVWMNVIRVRATYVPTAKFTTWLYTLAHNRLVDHWRATGRSSSCRSTTTRTTTRDDASSTRSRRARTDEPETRAQSRASSARSCAPRCAALPADAARGVPAASGRRARARRDRGADGRRRSRP